MLKSGQKQFLLNYWPILLTSHSCKLVEHVIYKHINFFESNNLSCSAQHAFHHAFSTIIQLIEFAHDISLALDLGQQVDALFIDF